MTGFVRRNGPRLELDGQPWYGVGVNSFSTSMGAILGHPEFAESVFATAKARGFRWLRLWGSGEGADWDGNPLFQPTPGEYRESALQAFDRLVDQAEAAGVRLVVTLVDGNASYGGAAKYAEWASVPREAFWSHPQCWEAYKGWVTKIVGRYRNRPGIGLWELANEPKGSGDRTGVVIRDWLRRAAQLVRTLDTNHLIGTGEEGYDVSPTGYSDYGADRHWLLDGDGGKKGISYTLNTAIDEIDVAGIHVYPGFWGLSPEQAVTWITDHAAIARRAGKPLFIGELGWAPWTVEVLARWIAAAESIDAAGFVPWQISPGWLDEFAIPNTAGPLIDALEGAARRANAKTPVVIPVPDPGGVTPEQYAALLKRVTDLERQLKPNGPPWPTTGQPKTAQEAFGRLDPRMDRLELEAKRHGWNLR